MLKCISGLSIIIILYLALTNAENRLIDGEEYFISYPMKVRINSFKKLI